MKKEYNVSVDNEMEMEMSDMCNLGRGAVEYGIEKGIEQGELRKAVECIENLINECNFTVEAACKVAKITVEEYYEYKDVLCVK